MKILIKRGIKYNALLKEKRVGLLLRGKYNQVYDINKRTIRRIGETAIELEKLGLLY